MKAANTFNPKELLDEQVKFLTHLQTCGKTHLENLPKDIQANFEQQQKLITEQIQKNMELMKNLSIDYRKAIQSQFDFSQVLFNLNVEFLNKNVSYYVK